MDEKIKKYLVSETSGKINAVAKDKNDNTAPISDEEIGEVAELFYDVLTYDIPEEKLSGVGERIERAIRSLVYDKHDKDSISTLFPSINKIEQYARKLLFIVDKDSYYKVVSRKDPASKGFKGILDALKPHFSKNTEEAMRNLRNNEDHDCQDWTLIEFYTKINAFLRAYLRLTLSKKEELEEIFNNPSIETDTDFSDYAKALSSKLKTNIKRIVELDTEENLQMLDLYAEEAGSDNNNLRKGKIHALMKTIPEKRMMLWGDAGAGKTTSIEYLAYMDAVAYLKDKTLPVPVIIYLGTTTNEHVSVWDYIIKKLDTDDETLTRMMQKGQVNLYFDGFNEIPMTERNMLKTKRRRELTELLNNYPDTFIIFTNRPQDGREFSNIPVFNILEMNEGQVSQFIEKNTDKTDVMGKINEAIASDENLKKMVTRPLILKSLIFIVSTTGDIPRREGQIIGRFLKALFTREKQEKYDEYLDERKITFLLRRIAYETVETKKTNAGLSEEELLDIMNRCQKEYNFTYDNMYTLELVVHLGIIEKRDDSYVFAHQSYQTYYNSLEYAALLGE